MILARRRGLSTAALHLALAPDVTNLGARSHVLAVSVAIRGTGIPVAWAIPPGGVQDPRAPHWLGLPRRLRAALGFGWEVVVPTDRGLASAELSRAIAACGWHPPMRAKAGGSFRPRGWHKSYALKKFAPKVGRAGRRVGRGIQGKSARLGCVLPACWEGATPTPGRCRRTCRSAPAGRAGTAAGRGSSSSSR